MLKPIIKIVVLWLGMISSFHLILSSLALSAKQIVDLSKTQYRFNKELAEHLIGQNANIKIGFLFLGLSFLFQLTEIVFSVEAKTIVIDGEKYASVDLFFLLSMFIMMGIFTLGAFGSEFFKKKTQKQVNEIVSQK